MRYILSITLFVILSAQTYVKAQNPGETELIRRMDVAVDQMERGEYEIADEGFLYVIKNLTALPSELAFYFGKNSFHLEKFKQSINWLNKYLQLKGTGGRFYSEASKYLELAEEAYLEQARSNREDLETELTSGNYDCGGLQKMICPVCKGEGVIIKRGPFDYIYETCPYSAGEPYLTCEEYNAFMQGNLDPKTE